MNRDLTIAEICRFIDSEVSLDPSWPVDGDVQLVEEGLIDSLGVLRIVAFLEDRFGVQVDPSEVTIEHFGDVSSIAMLVERIHATGDSDA